jgi:hypothetical protein
MPPPIAHVHVCFFFRYMMMRLWSHTSFPCSLLLLMMMICQVLFNTETNSIWPITTTRCKNNFHPCARSKNSLITHVCEGELGKEHGFEYSVRRWWYIGRPKCFIVHMNRGSCECTIEEPEEEESMAAKLPGFFSFFLVSQYRCASP